MADKPKWKPAQELALNQRGRTLLVSAAAGSGKTAVLTQRIVDILANENGDISRLLVVTFTRAAANEMRERIAAALSEAMMLVDGANEQERVKKREHLSRQLMLLGGSNISTIDSFSLDLVKSNFQATDLPPTFRLADEAELDPLRHEVMDETVDAMFESEPDFGKISDIFCSIRQENALSDALLALVTKLDHYAEGIDILLRSADEIEACATDILHTKFGELWKNTPERYAKFGVPLLDRALALMYSDPNSKKLKDKYEAIYLEIREHCQGVLDGIAAGDYDKIRRESAAPIPAFEHGTPKAEPDFAAIRPLITKFRDAWRENVTPLGAYSAAEVAETAAETAKILRMLHTALRRYSEEYRRIKLTREVMEFSDIARTAYELLVRADAREDDEDIATPLAKEMQKRFDAVYIDEYQDVNAMQDMTFRAISTPFNRFMVGDIKQSIYRFRGAQPAVFAGYLDKFQQIKTLNEGAEIPSKIFMSDCFRCDQKIIDFSNTVSGYLFSNHAKSISYTTDDDLHFAKERKPDAPPEEKCRVLVLNRKKRSNDSDGEDKEKNRVLEAKLIACEIAKLLEEKNADGTPRFSPGDIAVLMRSSKLAKPLAKELAARSIPTNDTTQQRFFENPEILCMYSLLAAIDNPFRDIYLTAALRSPFFGFTLEELVQIRHAGDPSTSLYSITRALKDAKEKDIPLPDDVQGKGDPSLSLYEAMQAAAHTDAIPAELKTKINDFLTRFATYRKKAQAQPVDKLIRFLYEDTHVMAFAGYEEKENGTLLRKGNLRRLYEYARTFEAGGFKGLYQFVRYVDSVMKNGTKMSAPDGAANAVSLLTIHHSKGLQYPICFVSGMGGTLNSDDLKPALLSDEKLGCATKLCNAGPFSRTDTFFRKVIATKIKQLNREEEMRVLYVALTRAKERLIVTGVIGSRPDELEKDTSLFASPGAELFATAASSPLGWILTALKHHGDYSDFAEKIPISEEELNEYIEGKGSSAESADAQDGECADAQDGELSEEEREAKAKAEAERQAELERQRAELEKRLAFVYPHGHLTSLPAKLSVSKLTPTALDVFDNGAAAPEDTERARADEKKRRVALERLLHTFDREPCFDRSKSEPSPAQKGTATHEFMQFCSFEAFGEKGVTEQNVANECDRLVKQHFLSEDATKAIRKDELKRFFESGLYRRLRAAAPANVHRETRFHLFLPASDFTANEALAEKLADEQLAVQGVIDLFFTDADGKLVLCDYKTDRLSPQALSDPALAAAELARVHGTQLSYYARALEEICGRRPDEILIYSLHLGRDLDISHLI